MYLAVSRLFLFLVLVCDWAGDPYFGQSLFSRPMSSQQAYCYATVYRGAIQSPTVLLRFCDLADLPQHSALVHVNPPPCTAAFLRDSTWSETTALLYTLMSLQC
jgi:hypothetical protein